MSRQQFIPGKNDYNILNHMLSNMTKHDYLDKFSEYNKTDNNYGQIAEEFNLCALSRTIHEYESGQQYGTLKLSFMPTDYQPSGYLQIKRCYP